MGKIGPKFSHLLTVRAAPPVTRKVYWGRKGHLWNDFFLPFLTKTKRKPLPSYVYGEIWPHSLQFWLWHFFGSRLGPSGDHSFGAGLDLTCSPFRGLNSDDFPFFTSSLGPLEPELDLFKDLKENGDIWEISLTVRWLRLLMPRLYLEWDFPNVANFFYKYL